MVVVNHMPLQSVFTVMFEGITKNSLLAIPFFVLAGNFISGGTLGKRLIDFCSTFLKNIRGGIPLACLISNALFGAISGSPPAATAVFAKIVHKPIAESDGEKMATGLVTSAAGLASIIPPSVIMIIYGISTDTSVSDMFIAGILPGVLLVVIMAVYLVLKCKKKAKDPVTAGEIGQSLKRGIPVLLLPVLVLGGIYSGFVTPTEAGALSAVYCAVVSIFGLKEIKFSAVPEILRDSIATSAQVFLLIAASAFFARALTISQLPQWITQSFGSLPRTGFLILLLILLLVVGCFFDPSAAILILGPMILPAATSLGISAIHLGIIFTVTLSVGMFTPPFGLNIFVAQSVLGLDMKEITKSLVPFILLYLIGVIIITFIPSISTILPTLL
jgi:TRAP transporter, DctM subunit